VQHLLGARRQARDERVAPPAALREAARELGAAQVREQRPLANDERRLREHRRALRLLADDLADPLPPAGEPRRELARAELRVRRLPLERRVDRGRAVALAGPPHEGVDVDVLVLQRVHHLVAERDVGGRRVGALHDVQRLRARLVVADDLLLVHPRQQRRQVDRVGEEPEPLVGDCHRGHVAPRGGVGELAVEELAHLAPPSGPRSSAAP
jgi:hypothetical protein